MASSPVGKGSNLLEDQVLFLVSRRSGIGHVVKFAVWATKGKTDRSSFGNVKRPIGRKLKVAQIPRRRGLCGQWHQYLGGLDLSCRIKLEEPILATSSSALLAHGATVTKPRICRFMNRLDVNRFLSCNSHIFVGTPVDERGRCLPGLNLDMPL